MPESRTVIEPIVISLIGGRYLIFDVNVVSYLRQVHHICGTSIGTLPQIPQQNLFLGLPIELMREEVYLLIEKKIAHIINDTHLHSERFGVIDDEERKKYLKKLRSKGLEVSQQFQAAQRERTQKALAKICFQKYHNNTANSEDVGTKKNLASECTEKSTSIDNLGSMPGSISIEVIPTDKSVDPYGITPTTSYLTCTHKPSHLINPVVRSSYQLYKYLHQRDYFILPGLRFGCDYNVYPGDPLRYHSHFIAVGYEWEQEIPIFDIIGGGRLGTAVKKGFLIGGHDFIADEVRTFSVEWGGM